MHMLTHMLTHAHTCTHTQPGTRRPAATRRQPQASLMLFCIQGLLTSHHRRNTRLLFSKCGDTEKEETHRTPLCWLTLQFPTKVGLDQPPPQVYISRKLMTGRRTSYQSQELQGGLRHANCLTIHSPVTCFIKTESMIYRYSK